jgi:hypothetical protein
MLRWPGPSVASCLGWQRTAREELGARARSRRARRSGRTDLRTGACLIVPGGGQPFVVGHDWIWDHRTVRTAPLLLGALHTCASSTFEHRWRRRKGVRCVVLPRSRGEALRAVTPSTLRILPLWTFPSVAGGGPRAAAVSFPGRSMSARPTFGIRGPSTCGATASRLSAPRARLCCFPTCRSAAGVARRRRQRYRAARGRAVQCQRPAQPGTRVRYVRECDAGTHCQARRSPRLTSQA